MNTTVPNTKSKFRVNFFNRPQKFIRLEGIRYSNPFYIWVKPPRTNFTSGKLIDTFYRFRLNKTEGYTDLNNIFSENFRLRHRPWPFSLHAINFFISSINKPIQKRTTAKNAIKTSLNWMPYAGHSCFDLVFIKSAAIH